MTEPEFLQGVKTLERGIGVALLSSSIALYREQLQHWAGSDWLAAVQALMDREEPLKKFPTIGQCKAALREAAKQRRIDHPSGCTVCQTTGWIMVGDPEADRFYGKPSGTMKRAIRCRCSKGMLMAKTAAQISGAEYSRRLTDNQADRRYANADGSCLTHRA